MSMKLYVQIQELEQRVAQHETRLVEAERTLRALPARPSKPIAEATAFLKEILATEPRPATELIRLARERGVAERTLRRAKAAVGVVSFRVSQRRGSPPVSWWRLPGPRPPPGSRSVLW